jgi:hypothetical protein
MDEIDKAKIGKKDEKLVGWDFIRKPKMNTNYPPMRAKGTNVTPSALRIHRSSSKTDRSNHDTGFFWLLVLFFIVLIIGTYLIGLW